MIQPIDRARHRPGGQQPAAVGGSALPAKETAPAPVFGPGGQIRPQGVAFDIAGRGEQVLVFLNGKRLEASLIDVTRARRWRWACQR